MLSLFLPVPFLFLGWDLWQVRKKSARKKALILVALGIIFMAYMCFPFTTKQYFMQGLIYAGVLYTPFFIISWVVVTVLLNIASHNQMSHEE